MSDKDKRADGPDDAAERELIDMEFQSMVEGLSLDQSAPTTFLDQLENFADQNRFQMPNLPRKKLGESFRGAISAFKKWKSGKNFREDDGAAL